MPDLTAVPGAGSTDRWRIGPDDGAVLVENADPLLPYLPYFLGGWDLRWAGADPGGRAADVCVSELADGGFRVASSGPGGADFTFDNPYDAANGLAGALISVYVARRPDAICLHAAAAMVGEGLVILLGGSFAGKSSVALHLAVLGNRFFGDDQISVTLGVPATGLCLGLTPKVRMPLPDDSGEPFREFVEEYTAMEGDGLVYLKLWEREAATFGETAPVRALVFLERGDVGAAELLPASRSEVVKSMVGNAFAPHLDSSRLVAGLTRLAGGVALHRLRFSSSHDAAALLSRVFRPAPR